MSNVLSFKLKPQSIDPDRLYGFALRTCNGGVQVQLAAALQSLYEGKESQACDYLLAILDYYPDELLELIRKSQETLTEMQRKADNKESGYLVYTGDPAFLK
jgi:hypothetical protein